MRTSIRPFIQRAAIAAAFAATASAFVYAATKGPDGGGYTASDATVYSLVDISGAGGGASVLAGIDDGAHALIV